MTILANSSGKKNLHLSLHGTKEEVMDFSLENTSSKIISCIWLLDFLSEAVLGKHDLHTYVV